MSGRSFVRAASVCAVLASPVVAMAAGGPRTLSPAFDQTAYIHPQRLVAVGGGRRLNLYCGGSGKPMSVATSCLSTTPATQCR